MRVSHAVQEATHAPLYLVLVILILQQLHISPRTSMGYGTLSERSSITGTWALLSKALGISSIKYLKWEDSFTALLSTA